MKFKQTGILLVFITVNLFSQPIFAQSSVWKVSKGAHYFYIGGTIHVLSADDYPLPQEFTAAYNDADEIIFETDMDKLNSPEFQAKLIASVTFSDNRTLASEITPNNYQKLEKYLASQDVAIANFSAFKPWGISVFITLIEYQKRGMKGEYGVDTYFNQLALSDNKKRGKLETVDQQLAAMTSMENIEPNKIIEYSLRDIEQLPEFIKIMKRSWLVGDIDTLSKSDIAMQMKNETPTIYKALLTDRNNAWMKSLPLLIKSKNIEFVLVGAMHLAGKEGLLHHLTMQGFKVEPL